MMSALVPSTPSESVHSEERQRLLTELLDAVKQCQIRFGGRAELATESDPCIAVLCQLLEAALCHGLRTKPLNKNSSALRQVTEIVSSSLHLNRNSPQEHQVFWHYVREHLTRHEYERYLVLKQVWTDTGRGRAWLRSSLNERSLERYLHCMLGSSTHLSMFYEDWAFLQDQERSSMLPVMAAGLGSILFAISIDNKDLNQVTLQGEVLEPVVHGLTSSEPIIAAWEPEVGGRRRPERRRRKVPAYIITFDDDDDDETASSAPATCLSSPTVTDQCNAAAGLSRSDDEDRLVTQSPSSDFNSLHDLKSTQNPKEQPSSDTSMCTVNKDSRQGTPPADTERPKDLQLNQPSSAASTTEPVDKRYRNLDARSWTVATVAQQSQTLTPVNNISVGELIPVTLTDEPASEEDSLSVPSYSDDTDCAAAALLATQKLLQSNCVDFTPQEPVVGKTPDFISNVPGEVREALLVLLARKEELQAEVRALKRLLEQAQDDSTELRAELTETGRQNREKMERLEGRIQALFRENELLKHQLRKYVGAVQLLKRDGSQAHEALASLEAAQPRAGESAYPDYHYEAREYEKKLIQVAEMHGELMEFNDRLHRLLQQKDAALHRLREELVDLRGPLPDDATSDDDLSVTSDYDNSSLCAATRALVNIWIPSAFLTGGSSDVHHVYQVFIRIRDDEWNIYRRYAQFYALHKELKKQDAIVTTFDFPPKKTIGNKDSRFVEERRRRLQHYLRCIVNHLVQTNTDLATSPDKELLVTLVPFFGEICGGDDRSRRKRAGSRNPFSRLARNTETTPQYTGL